MAKLERILCPVDFSDTSEHAFRFAGLLAEQFGARLTLLHVMEDAPLFAGFESMPAASVLEEAEEAARQQLAKLAANAPASVETELIRGGTYKSIVAYAEQHQADLIVMGTHGRSGLEYAFFGSVTERVMRRSPCPVLVVPPPKRDENHPERK